MKKIIKRGLIILLSVAILGLALLTIINYRVIRSANPYIIALKEAPKGDAALVLGALVHKSGRVSDILADRLDMGIELYKNDKVKKLLMSGDHGQKNYDEVNAMRLYASSREVDCEDIFMDHAGFSTYESIYRAKHIFGAKKIIIVTQEYHLSRAVYIARQLGMEAYGIPSDKHYYPKINSYKMRESLARCKDYVLVNFLKPKPTYLGKVIDLSGDGRETKD